MGAFVVTGGSRGLGRAIAEEAHRNGFPVVILSRNEADLKHAASDIQKTTGGKEKVTFYAVDLQDEKKVNDTVKQIQSDHGGIRALINNAGTWTGGKTLNELSRVDIQRSLDLNFYSAFNITKAVLKKHEKGTDLSVINIGATSSLQGWSEVAAFSLGKGALRIFSQALAREVGPQGVHVAHLIIDGVLDNERTHKLNPKTPKDRFIKLGPVAKDIVRVVLQEKNCWTFEWDVRPYNEEW